MTKGRLEAFTDGVFAIAITLLVIELRPPEVGPHESLAGALWDLWPSYFAYIVSFLVIGVMWLNHHRMFDPVQEVDTPLLVLNLQLLLWTVLIPFPTAVVARYLAAGTATQARVAVAFYGVVVLGAAIGFTLLFFWITRNERILGALPPKAVVRASRIRFGVGVVVYAVAVLLAFVWPPLALAVHGATALYYAFDQSSVPSPEAGGS